jgi:diaminohydroxyphosphoribosylaminopyrimidine deaminase/5-amino-6-(5-phosphoribosylamino)uracil reductase
VVGCRDLNPRVSGRGISRLRRAGIRVDVGCLEARSHVQNRAFFRWIRDQRPWVTLKVASTLDGCIASRGSGPRWITGVPARTVAHELRATHDAVMVGVGTVLADDPRLTVRLGHSSARGQPLRVVLDGRLRTPTTARLLRADPANRPLLIGAEGDAAAVRRGRLLTRAGAEVLLLPATDDGRIALPTLLQTLALRGIQSLLVEGGSHVLGAFVAGRAADAVAWFLAPRLAGGGVPVVAGPGLDWRSLLALTPPTVRTVGRDLLITAEVVTHRSQKRRPE